MKNPILIAFIVMTISSHAQIMKITGNVSDSSGPLPGAIIVVKGTEIGAQADFDGNFSIAAEKGESLVFSHLGFKTKTSKIKSDKKQLIRLREDVTVCFPSLDYYLPFNIYELKGFEENWHTTQDIGISLSKIPGVQVRSTNSFSSSSIRMRGDNNTIVIVDGIRYDASILNTLNPEDIEHIAVATDAAASNYLRTR